MAISADQLRYFRPLVETDDKYSHGVVGFVTGSAAYPGAAILGVSAAIRAGAGLIRYWGISETSKTLILARPEVVLGFGRADCWVVGSGVVPKDAELAQRIQQLALEELPMVVDAGALEIVEFSGCKATALLTPHVGEMSNLLSRFGETYSRSEIAADPATFALLASEITGQTVLLKGHETCIARAGRVEKVGPNSPHLATAGSGDVLAGLLGALFSRNVEVLRANPEVIVEIAMLAVQIHSAAAEAVAKEKIVSALDVAEKIGVLLAEIL